MYLEWKSVDDASDRGEQRQVRTAEQAVPVARTENLLKELAGDREALIYRPCRSATTSAKRISSWVLLFEREVPPFTEPLMGWTGSEDPLAQLTLSFPSLESAVAFAERHDLAYRICGSPDVNAHRRVSADQPFESDYGELLTTYLQLAWMQGRYDRCTPEEGLDLDEALVRPSRVFSSPKDVVFDARLDLPCKRRILQHWAWDEYLIDLAAFEMPGAGPPSRLDEVQSALSLLEALEKSSVIVRQTGGGTSTGGARP